MTAVETPRFEDGADSLPVWEPPAICRCRHSEGLHWQEEDGEQGCDGTVGTQLCTCRGFTTWPARPPAGACRV